MKLLLHKIIPHHTISRLVGKITHSRKKWLKNFLIRQFIRQHNINMHIADESDYRYYESFNAFFTRQLRPSARPIAQGEWDIACPVDGTVSEFGSIYRGRLLQAKGLDYDLVDLLGGNMELTKLFQQGHFATFYLSPKDYHRVHMPFAGTLKTMTHVPGRLYSVSPELTSELPNLYTKNERVISVFESRLGKVAVIMVGAVCVGSISTRWAGTVTPCQERSVNTKDYADAGRHSMPLARGEEMGHFNMGSTVILLLPPVSLEWEDRMAVDGEVQMGQKVARFMV